MIAITELGADTRLWDAFVRNEPRGTCYHLAGWREVMDGVLGCECRYRVGTDDAGTWQGLLPLVRVKSALLGHYLVSMPFLNAGGPLGGGDAERALVQWAVGEAKRSRADLLELRSRTPIEGDVRTSNRKITVRLPLPADVDALWASFPSKLRSQIRRPRKEGLDVRFGADQREAFYDVFAHNMRALGTPVLPPRFFERIAAAFPEVVEFAVVYRGPTPVAAGCGFVWRREFELHWASSLREYSRLAPNMLLYAALMERMIGRGVQTFDFGRCTPGSSTHSFKQQWGGTDVALPWGQWSAHDMASTPSPERPLFVAARACWRRLPFGVTTRLGPILARRLP